MSGSDGTLLTTRYSSGNDCFRGLTFLSTGLYFFLAETKVSLVFCELGAAEGEENGIESEMFLEFSAFSGVFLGFAEVSEETEL